MKDSVQDNELSVVSPFLSPRKSSPDQSIGRLSYVAGFGWPQVSHALGEEAAAVTEVMRGVVHNGRAVEDVKVTEEDLREVGKLAMSGLDYVRGRGQGHK